MQRRQFLTIGAGALATTALQSASASSKTVTNKGLVLPIGEQIQTGGSRMIDIGGGHHVWTKKVGGGPIKVLLLHGGPGADHCYFECFEDFLPPNGIEFYYYDQLGSTNSDNPDDPKLWTVERYTNEVEAVRSALGLDQFYLVGHSWGGMLTIEYAIRYPQHLKGAVISNMTAGIKAYERYAAVLRAQMPPEVTAVLDRYEKVGNFEAPEYQSLVMEHFYNQHVCRLQPWPEPLQRGFAHLNQKIYNYMQGPNEMVVTGEFKNWERWDDLHRIQARTLVMGAKYDEMSPDDLRKMASLIPHGRAWISDKGSHMAMYDDQLPYFTALLEFLKET